MPADVEPWREGSSHDVPATHRSATSPPSWPSSTSSPRRPTGSTSWRRPAACGSDLRWTFAERWLPAALVRQRAGAPRVVDASRAHRGRPAAARPGVDRAPGGHAAADPPPFGIARNGEIVYAIDGDVYVRDAVDSPARLLIGGPGRDFAPAFSRRGDKFIFFRETAPETSDVYVADADGSDVRRIGGPFMDIDTWDVTPTVRRPSSPAAPSTPGSGSSTWCRSMGTRHGCSTCRIPRSGLGSVRVAMTPGSRSDPAIPTGTPGCSWSGPTAAVCVRSISASMASADRTTSRTGWIGPSMAAGSPSCPSRTISRRPTWTQGCASTSRRSHPTGS